MAPSTGGQQRDGEAGRRGGKSHSACPRAGSGLYRALSRNN